MRDRPPFWQGSRSDDEERDAWQKPQAPAQQQPDRAQPDRAQPRTHTRRRAAVSSANGFGAALGQLFKLGVTAIPLMLGLRAVAAVLLPGDGARLGATLSESFFAAIPPQAATEAKQMLEELSGALRASTSSNATFARLGIQLTEVNAEFLEFNALPPGLGAVVTEASAAGLAQSQAFVHTTAGLRPFPLGVGDVIFQVNGAGVFGKSALQTAVDNFRGDRLSLSVLRGASRHQVTVVLSGPNIQVNAKGR